ncbi:MAG: tetratricopeptide repeat protein, partial [Luteolibacter sp.]
MSKLRQAMIRAWLTVMMLLAVTAAAEPSADELRREGITAFRQGYRNWSPEEFGKAAWQFAQAVKREPASAENHYWLGVARFHRMLSYRHQNPPQEQRAENMMNQAIEAFETAVHLAPAHAECHALLGTLYGMKINGSMLRGIRYGPKVQEHQKQALAQGAKNPRVIYLLGASRYHVAKDNHDFREALATLQKAAALFSDETVAAPDCLKPLWGRSSCLTFIAHCHLRLGHQDQALNYYRQALELHPADHIAR